MKTIDKDTVGGALMVLVGAGAILEGVQHEIGSLRHVGPGFFPVCLGAILAAVGAMIAVKAWLERAAAARVAPTGAAAQASGQAPDQTSATASTHAPAGAPGQAPGKVRPLPVASSWRGWTAIAGGLVAFIGLGRYGGLVPATTALVFLSALGDRANTVRGAVLLTAIMLAICVVVFWWALGINLPLFRWG
jgi:hypothetical protein